MGILDIFKSNEKKIIEYYEIMMDQLDDQQYFINNNIATKHKSEYEQEKKMQF